MNLSKLTFSDIMERNLLYYDHKEKKACALFCKKLQIDYLPSIDGRSKYVYDKDRDTFTKQPIEEYQKLQADQPIFNKDNIDRFRNNEHQVLFVYEGEVLVGVVHVCDYNRDIVLETIQQWVLAFEQLLRKYLVLSGKINDDLWSFLSERPNNNRKRTKDSDNLSPFQCFYLTDLMLYLKEGKMKLSINEKEYKALPDLRNAAMHGKDTISNEEFYYNTEDLHNLLHSVEILKSAYQRALKATNEKRAELVKALNRSRLELITKEGEKAFGMLLSY